MKTLSARTGIAGAAIATLVLLAGLVPSALYAQSLEDKIGSALQAKKPLTRGLTIDPQAAADKQAVDKLRTRSISVEPAAPPTPDERAQIAAISRDKPAIDLEIYFDYNSANISPQAAPAVAALGNTLSKDQFRGTVFFINGYTDAKGSAEYNQDLSQRRADSVRRVLIERYRLPPDTLVTAGFGKDNLKNPANPFADENRRVQIVNTTVTASH
ncbi:MAG: OmpA family protein [Pseudomonadota bacterium]|jgi:outer membrane protein OmpA-like peptidoglycan-associated protein